MIEPRFPIVAAASLSALLAATAPTRANDSTAVIGVGGLTLVKSDAIVMQSEDLFISEKQVNVDYVFLNTSTADIEALVAFPLPDVVYTPEARIPEFLAELNFATSVDGAPLQYEIVTSAWLNGKDITARLAAVGLPALADWENFEKATNAKSRAELKALVAEGLLGNEGDDANPYWLAKWVTKTTVTRRQVFPAGRPIRVSHSYTPLAGGSVGSLLSPAYRNNKDFAADVRVTRAKYCIDDAFLRGLDGVMKGMKDKLAPEVWLSYVLISGANWKGPIGSFRLVIDKGEPKNMVSFCAPGLDVRKIAPTRFEITARDFTPKKDLDILIVREPQ